LVLTVYKKLLQVQMNIKEVLLVIPKNKLENFYQEFKKTNQKKQQELKIYEFPCLKLKVLDPSLDDLSFVFKKIKSNFYDYYVFSSYFAVERFFKLFFNSKSKLSLAFFTKNRFAFVGEKSFLFFKKLIDLFNQSSKIKNVQVKTVIIEIQAEKLIKRLPEDIKILIFCNKESIFYQKKDLLKIQKIKADFVNLYQSETIQPDLNQLIEFLKIKKSQNNKYIFFSSPKLVNAFYQIYSSNFSIFSKNRLKNLGKQKIKTISIGETTYNETKKIFPELSNLISTKTSYLSMLDLVCQN